MAKRSDKALKWVKKLPKNHNIFINDLQVVLDDLYILGAIDNLEALFLTDLEVDKTTKKLTLEIEVKRYSRGKTKR